jgi:DNA-binding CsgD family transcriptional regulator
VPSAGRTALLERQRELEALSEGLDRARAGEGSLLLIEGAPGVGKTELVRAVLAMAERSGMTMLVARGSELERSFAFGVVRQLLEPVLRQSRERATAFVGAAGPAARLFGLEDSPAWQDDVGFEALHALYWLVVNLADHGPLALVVDDCHWADPESLRFLNYLAQRIDELPVAMVVAGRSPDPAQQEAAALWPQMAARPSAIMVNPVPLSPKAAAALAVDRLGVDADEAFCLACHTATGGNPLFLRELLRGLAAAGVRPSAEAASQVQDVGPAAVRRFVLHRLTALGSSAAELARTVAVLGDDSELQLVGRVCGLSDEAVRDAADDLVRADIFVHSDRPGFVHPIVRAALYEDLVPGERRARHASVADALLAAGAPAERISAHLLLTTPTGDRRRVESLRAAAGAAARGGAPRVAAVRLRRALAESPGEQERAEILAELGLAEVAAMQFEDAQEHLQECMLSRATLTTRAQAASTLARCATVSGVHSAARAADALASLADELWPRDAERSLEVHSELLMVATAVLELRGGLPGHLQRFRERAQGHPGFEAVARIHSAHERLLRGEQAAAAVAEVQGALAAGLPPGARTGAALLALIAFRLGERYDEALLMLDAAMEQARREGHATRQGIIHAERAAVALGQGSLRDAEVEAETGLLLVEDQHLVFPQLLAVAITVHVERGALAEAAALADRGAWLEFSEPRAYLYDYLAARARLRIAEGDVPAAVADLQRCGRDAEALGVWGPSHWMSLAAPALAAVGDSDGATRLAREALERARRIGASGHLGQALRAAARVLGDEQRLGLLEEAVSVLEGSGSRLELAHALADLGRELNRLGQRRDGRDAERRAIGLAQECGASALAERAMVELHAGPGRRARAELTGRNALTAAEWRVCRQAADGRTNREIAQALFVTEKTVERHLSSAYHKLEIRSRFQLSSAIGESRAAVSS